MQFLRERNFLENKNLSGQLSSDTVCGVELTEPVSEITYLHSDVDFTMSHVKNRGKSQGTTS